MLPDTHPGFLPEGVCHYSRSSVLFPFLRPRPTVFTLPLGFCRQCSWLLLCGLHDIHPVYKDDKLAFCRSHSTCLPSPFHVPDTSKSGGRKRWRKNITAERIDTGVLPKTEVLNKPSKQSPHSSVWFLQWIFYVQFLFHLLFVHASESQQMKTYNFTKFTLRKPVAMPVQTSCSLHTAINPLLIPEVACHKLPTLFFTAVIVNAIFSTPTLSDLTMSTTFLETAVNCFLKQELI